MGKKRRSLLRRQLRQALQLWKVREAREVRKNTGAKEGPGRKGQRQFPGKSQSQQRGKRCLPGKPDLLDPDSLAGCGTTFQAPWTSRQNGRNLFTSRKRQPDDWASSGPRPLLPRVPPLSRNRCIRGTRKDFPGPWSSQLPLPGSQPSVMPFPRVWHVCHH